MTTGSPDKLLARIRRCSECEGLPLGPRPLLQAAASARILIAGQAPGRVAHESGIPFDDRSGDRLRDWLGVDRETFYDPSRIAIVPMGFCFPGTGSGGDLPPRAECAPRWREAVLSLLSSVELTVLIGLHAQRWHLADRCGRTLSDNVARWREFWPAQMPLPHPSPRNQYWIRKHPDVTEAMLPSLKRRVSEILDAG